MPGMQSPANEVELCQPPSLVAKLRACDGFGYAELAAPATCGAASAMMARPASASKAGDLVFRCMVSPVRVAPAETTKVVFCR